MPLLRRSIEINAAPPEVWRHFIDPALAKPWMGLRLTCGWNVGDELIISDTPLGDDYSERGTLLAFVPGSLLSFTHLSPLWGISEHATLSFQLEPRAHGCVVTLIHELPDVEAILEHSDFFWRVGFELLKKQVEATSRP
jgi:uncharacterized protein YndB with AHSA1/START domain